MCNNGHSRTYSKGVVIDPIHKYFVLKPFPSDSSVVSTSELSETRLIDSFQKLIHGGIFFGCSLTSSLIVHQC